MAEEKKKQVRQIVKADSTGGKVVKPSSGFKETAKDIGASLMETVVIPAAKDMLYDFIVGGASMSIYKDRQAPGRTSRGRRTSNGSTARYNRPYNSISDGRNDRATEDAGRYIMNTHGMNVWCPPHLSMQQCYEILDELCDQIKEYGRTSVSDYYQTIGHTGENPRMERRWGWEDLDGIIPLRDPDLEGYYIPFPRQIPID